MISRMNSRYYDDLFSKSKGQYTSFLRPGSCFIGTQLSDKRTHEVQIHLKEVDFDKSKLSGFLRIQSMYFILKLYIHIFTTSSIYIYILYSYLYSYSKIKRLCSLFQSRNTNQNQYRYT